MHVGARFHFNCIRPGEERRRALENDEHAVHLMVRPVHDEAHAFGDGAELPDDELIADEGEEVEDVAFEVLGVFGIVVVGIVQRQPSFCHCEEPSGDAAISPHWHCWRGEIATPPSVARNDNYHNDH